MLVLARELECATVIMLECYGHVIGNSIMHTAVLAHIKFHRNKTPSITSERCRNRGNSHVRSEEYCN